MKFIFLERLTFQALHFLLDFSCNWYFLKFKTSTTFVLLIPKEF